MSKRRQNDPSAFPARYRSERLHEDKGQWYFSTREASLEGPYENKCKAVNALQTYKRTAHLMLLASACSVDLTHH